MRIEVVKRIRRFVAMFLVLLVVLLVVYPYYLGRQAQADAARIFECLARERVIDRSQFADPIPATEGPYSSWFAHPSSVAYVYSAKSKSDAGISYELNVFRRPNSVQVVYLTDQQSAKASAQIIALPGNCIN